MGNATRSRNKAVSTKQQYNTTLTYTSRFVKVAEFL